MKFSSNHFVSLAFIYIISSVLVVHCVSIANGCGSYGFLINNGLKTVGEGGLIDCCNAHDYCYSDCKGKSYCDQEFHNCLLSKCQELPTIRKTLCKLDTKGMVVAVKLFGEPAYCQKKTSY